MQYLTYDEYQALGGQCDLTAFNKSVVRVCGVIDSETHGRLHAFKELPEEVKHCVRELIDYVKSNVGSTVTSRSQSAGGVSESESYKNADEKSADMHEIIYDYLASVYDMCGVPLLYRGCTR